jgi:Trk-type K+ transport system membrane component
MVSTLFFKCRGPKLIVVRWLGVFDGVSAFNNAGMSLLDLNMVRHPAYFDSTQY